MDINRAKEIITALAEGVDPTTGELLPEDSVYNKGDIIRALYTVLSSLDAKKPKKKLPENAGKPWTNEEEKRLRELYSSGLSKKEISSELCRTAGSKQEQRNKQAYIYVAISSCHLSSISFFLSSS
jgi:hypothetical protein